MSSSSEKPTVAVIGASSDRSKYGNKSVRAHLQQGYDVFPIHPREDEIEGLQVYRSVSELPVEQLSRISVYVPPSVGINLLEEIQAKGADEVWFNPGSESPELLASAAELGLEVITACSIVNVGLSPAALDD